MAQWMYEICGKYGYKLIIGCGWWKVGSHLHSGENLFLLDRAIPHNLIFPHCDAIIHHGGSGTTHSAARSGKPQMLVPLLLDQPYWAYRVSELGLGPGGISIARVSKAQLEQRVVGLMTSAVYKQNATSIGEKVRQENGIEALCAYIERIGAAHP
jgi:UDP:flavonoid glycosyltransferase YjiC (YdhE family)